MKSDVRVLSVETFLVDTECRTPLKFGAVVVERAPIGYARATVETASGSRATGWGAMFIMDLWAWPVSEAGHEAKNAAMCRVLERYAALVAGYGRRAHPIEIFAETEADLARIAREAAAEHAPGEEMPFLAALVAASPVDHAVHDAFGRANGIDSFLGCGPGHMGFDLSRHLGDQYAGVYPSQFLRQGFAPRLAVFHLVGGLDVLRREDVKDAPDDGVPNSLDDWIARDGVFCLKVKLRGRDLEWDLKRTREVAAIYHEARASGRAALPPRPHLTADTNEQCESPDYMVEYLDRLRAESPDVYDELLYVEQPTERDLRAHGWDMRPIARRKPVLIDESLTSVEDFKLAMELGWSGIALRSCKCLSADLMFVPMAELAGVPYAVQDLTNPSIALLESVGLAAKTHTIMGVEANSRQFFPGANARVAEVHPGIANVRRGVADASSLSGPGLGMRVEEIPGFVEAVERADAARRRPGG